METIKSEDAELFIRKQIKNCPNLEIFYQGDTVASFEPSDFLWGYSYHSHCIPPFKPSSVLILGYGRGHIASLIRKIHGSDVKVTGVDLIAWDYKYVEYKIVIADAKDYVKESTSHIFTKNRFDYIVVDLFDGYKVPDFVFESEFASRLYQMTKKMLCLNVMAEDFGRLKAYHDYNFKFHRMVPLFLNSISFWGI